VGCKNIVLDVSEVIFMLLELAGADGDEFCHREGCGHVGDEEGCKSNVEWEKGLNTVSHVVGGIAC
jgi:hypothetical protein